MSAQRRNGRREPVRGRRSNGATPLVRSDRALPLGARLQSIAERVAPTEIDEIWIFPPLPERETAAEFILLACYPTDGNGGNGRTEERRRILTAHVEARTPETDGEDVEWVQQLRHQGVAPREWISGLADRLLGRLEEAGIPRVIQVAGERGRWIAAVDSLTVGNGTSPGNGALDEGHGPPDPGRSRSSGNGAASDPLTAAGPDVAHVDSHGAA